MKQYKPVTPGRRFRHILTYKHLTTERPERSLTGSLKKTGGRSGGKVSVRHIGGGVKRLYRFVDFKRDKLNIPAKVQRLEYDPNRGVDLALIAYADGEKRYILAPIDLKVGSVVISGENADLVSGNAVPLRNVPVGTFIHNLELAPGRGGQMVRGAGTAAILTAREEDGYVQVKLPSGEVRRVLGKCYATIGQLGNIDVKNIKIGKAGIKRYMGIRPTVRGVAMHPAAHPHGGGEGRSGIGMKTPKTPWGKLAFGVKTRNRKHTDKYIVSRRKK